MLKRLHAFCTACSYMFFAGLACIGKAWASIIELVPTFLEINITEGELISSRARLFLCMLKAFHVPACSVGFAIYHFQYLQGQNRFNIELPSWSWFDVCGGSWKMKLVARWTELCNVLRNGEGARARIWQHHRTACFHLRLPWTSARRTCLLLVDYLPFCISTYLRSCRPLPKLATLAVFVLKLPFGLR